MAAAAVRCGAEREARGTERAGPAGGRGERVRRRGGCPRTACAGQGHQPSPQRPVQPRPDSSAGCPQHPREPQEPRTVAARDGECVRARSGPPRAGGTPARPGLAVCQGRMLAPGLGWQHVGIPLWQGSVG